MRAPAALASALMFLACGCANRQPVNESARTCGNEYIVGSHLPKRACATVAEREALRREGQERMENLHRSSAATPFNPNKGAGLH